MNTTLQQLAARKSTRAYTSREISAEERRAILDAALQAPTAGNMTLYSILEITDPALKERLSETCDHQPFIAQAKMVLVFCADYQRWYDLFCRQLKTVRKPGAGDLLLAQADTIIAAQNAVVAAESIGIGSCYIGDITENFEIHRELFGLPRYVVPTCMLCFGFPDESQQKRAKPKRFEAEDVVFQNQYDPTRAPSMEQMLQKRHGGMSEAELKDWVDRFCTRKWNSEFSVEMSRSCAAIIRSWCEED